MILTHCHLWPEGMTDREDDFGIPGRAEHLSRFAQELGFEKAIGLAPFEVPEGQSTARISPEENSSRWLADAIADYDNIVGFASLDPSRPDAAERVGAAKELGLVGVKVHPPIFRIVVDDPKHDDFYAAIERAGMPLMFHTGYGSWPWPLEDYSVLKVERVAKRFRAMRIIVAHCGGAAFCRDVLALLQSNPNCYGDLAMALRPEAGWYVPSDELRLIINCVGAGRLVYGVDYPWCTMETVRRDLEIIHEWELSVEDERKILHENAERLIRPVEVG